LQIPVKSKDEIIIRNIFGELIRKYLEWFASSEEFVKAVIEKDCSEVDELRSFNKYCN